MPRASATGNHRHAILTLALATVALFGYLQFFNAFAVPYPDFFQYRENALWYLQGRLPEYFKRLPLFPLLIGFLSLLMPGPEPELLAAELLNLFLAPACLWLVYRIARRFVSVPASTVIVVLFAVNRAMVYSVAEPNVEICLLATVLLAIDLALQGSAWAYAAAFLTSLTRFDAALVIPVIALKDWLTTSGRSRVKNLRWASLASVGVVAWAVLSLRHSPLVTSYAEELAVRVGNPADFVKGTLSLAADIFPGINLWPSMMIRLALLGELVLIAAGSALLFRRARRLALVPLAFGAAYSLIHVLFPAYLSRYSLPVLWIAYLAMAAVVEEAIAGLKQPGRRPMRAILIGSLTFVMAASSLASSIRFMRSDYVRSSRATFRQAGEWYREAAGPNDKIIATLWHLVSYYSGRPADQVLYTGWLSSKSPDELVDELARRGVTYVAWDNWYDQPRSYDARRHKGYLLSELKAHHPETLELVKRFKVGSEELIVYRFHPHANNH